MKNQFKKIFKIFFPIFIGILFIYLSIKETTLNERKLIIHNILNSNYQFILLSIILGIMSHLSRAYRWLFLLNSMGYKPKLYNSILSIFIAYLSNLAIPRSGEIARASVMHQYEGIPFEKGFGTIIAERTIDLIMLFIILTCSLFLNYELLASTFNLQNVSFSNLIIIFLFVSILVLCLYFIIVRLNKNLSKKIAKFFIGLKEGLIAIFKMQKKIEYVFHTIFIWIMYLAMFYVIKWTLIETYSLTFEAILLGFVFGAISLSASNGGIGIYPYSVSLVLISYGISKEPSIAFGWIIWSSQTLMVLVLGSLSFFILPLINKKNFL